MKNFFFVKKITKKLFSKASIMGSSKWTYVKTKNWVAISYHSMKIEVFFDIQYKYIDTFMNF